MTTPTYTLVDFVHEEQACLWNDLDDAIRYSANGAWSIRSGNVAIRILRAARLVGPTPWGSVSYRLVAGGVYQAVLAVGGIEPDLPPDEAEWLRADDLMRDHGGTRETIRPEMAATLVAIERDRSFIADYAEPEDTA